MSDATRHLDRWAEATGLDDPFARLAQELPGGVRVRPLYTAGDVDAARAPRPRVRPRGAPGAAWDIRTTVSHPDPAEANRRILDDLAGGATSVLLQLDGGIDVRDADALDRLLDGVHLEMARVALDAGADFLPAAAALDAVWRRRGTPAADARADFLADPLGAAARAGRSERGLDAGLAELGALASWVDAERPGCTAACVDGSVAHEAGADAVQDLAFAIAAGVEYLRAMEAAGVPPGRAAGRILFRLSVGSELFLETAKLRAARLLWCRVLEACGVEPSARRMRLEVRTARRLMTRRDPWVNILRNTACCFIGAIAGADVVVSIPFDETLGLPADAGRRLARNTQIVLHEECRLDAVEDPAAGAWAIEALTADFCALAWAAFAELEAAGGYAAALREGRVQRAVAAAAAAREGRVARRRRPLLGVSEFPNPDEVLPERPPAPARPRTGAAAARIAAPADAPPALAAALAARAGRGSAPEPIEPLPARRLAEPFERLREAADAHAARAGERPRVFLACLGPLAEHNARSSFARNLLGAAGIEAVQPRGARDAAAAADSFRASGCRLAVLCASDALYEAWGADAARALKEAGAERLWLAGKPGDREERERAAGVDGWIHLGCDALAFLEDVCRRLGVQA